MVYCDCMKKIKDLLKMKMCITKTDSWSHQNRKWVDAHHRSSYDLIYVSRDSFYLPLEFLDWIVCLFEMVKAIMLPKHQREQEIVANTLSFMWLKHSLWATAFSSTLGCVLYQMANFCLLSILSFQMVSVTYNTAWIF